MSHTTLCSTWQSSTGTSVSNQQKSLIRWACHAIHSIEVGGSLAALSEYYELGRKGTEVHDAIGKKRLDFSAEELEAYGGYCVQDVELTYKVVQSVEKRLPKL